MAASDAGIVPGGAATELSAGFDVSFDEVGTGGCGDFWQPAIDMASKTLAVAKRSIYILPHREVVDFIDDRVQVHKLQLSLIGSRPCSRTGLT
jgi:hypothetical protein